MDAKNRLINYYKNNLFIQKYIRGMDSSTNEIVLAYNGLTKNISIDDLENLTDETAVISFLNPNIDLREEQVVEQKIDVIEPKVVNGELDKETLNDIKILTEIKSKTGMDNMLKEFAVNETTGLIDIKKAIDIVEKNTINEVINSIKDNYDFDLDLQNYDITGKFIGNKSPANRTEEEKIMSSFNNLKVYLEAANMYPDQVQFTEEDINKKMKEYIDKVKMALNPTVEKPIAPASVEKNTNDITETQSAGFADIFVLCLIVLVYAIIIVNLILKLI